MADRGKNKRGKVQRVLGIYKKLLKDVLFDTPELVNEYSANERTIQRDIADLKAFVSEDDCSNSIIYDYDRKGYRLDHTYSTNLTTNETLAVCKILLESRGLKKIEMESIIKKLIDGCSSEDSRNLVKRMIKSERDNYIQPNHNKVLMDKMRDISKAIFSNKYIEISYSRLKEGKTVEKKLKPVAIMFSDHYFYLAAYIDMDDQSGENSESNNGPFPTFYRFDRIKKLKVLDEEFKAPHDFKEADFRNKTMFMYGDGYKRRKIHFIYNGSDLDYVLDHIPTARKIKEEKIPGAEAYEMLAEVIGDGIEKWMKSQGDKFEILQ